MKLGWSHPVTYPSCLPRCGCHSNSRCTFSSYGRLEAERANQFWWNLVYNSKLGLRWRSHNQILKFVQFKMADVRHVGKYWKCHNSPSNGPTGMQLEWSHPIRYCVVNGSAVVDSKNKSQHLITKRQRIAEVTERQANQRCNTYFTPRFTTLPKTETAQSNIKQKHLLLWSL